MPYDTTEGIPCTVTLNVGAAPAPEITVTRADNSLSTLSSLKIFVYDKDGQVCQNVATLSSTDITENGTYGNDTDGNDTDGNRNGETLYKVSIETTSGKKQLFAIANYRSGYWDQSGIDSLCNQAEQGALTLAQLRDGVISLADNNFNINTDAISTCRRLRHRTRCLSLDGIQESCLLQEMTGQGLLPIMALEAIETIL